MLCSCPSGGSATAWQVVEQRVSPEFAMRDRAHAHSNTSENRAVFEAWPFRMVELLKGKGVRSRKIATLATAIDTEAAVKVNFEPGLHVAPGRVADATAYARYIGRWSRLVVPAVITAAEVTQGCRPARPPAPCHHGQCVRSRWPPRAHKTERWFIYEQSLHCFR
jgi:hypothetical protein